jgi:phosphoglycerate dehydrogenase-like enzyme
MSSSTTTDGRPLVLADPTPRAPWMIFTEEHRARLEDRVHLVLHEDGPMPDAMVEEHLPEAEIILGQISLPAERIARAPKLRAVINVEGNWKPNLDYAECQRRGIWALSIAPCMGPAVAEMCLALALDLARGITAADRVFRRGEEAYGILGNLDAFLLRGQPMGLIGFGNLGRALLPLLAPFGGHVRVYDPWLTAGYLREQGCEPSSLDELLRESKVIFILAGVTTENQGFLGREQLERIREGSAVVLASRAAVVDFDALVELARAGHFRAAIDVFPREPVPEDDPVRKCEGILLSPHRAGGMRETYARLSEMLIEDIELILAGMPPVRLQRADPRTASLGRSR